MVVEDMIIGIAIVGGTAILGVILVSVLNAWHGRWMGWLLSCTVMASTCALVLFYIPIRQPYKALVWWAAGSAIFLIGIVVGRQIRKQHEKADQFDRSHNVVDDLVD